MSNFSSPDCAESGELTRRAAADALGAAVDWSYGGISLARPRQSGMRTNSGPPAGLCEALEDPIVEALMAADGTDRKHVAALMHCVAARTTARRTIKKGASS